MKLTIYNTTVPVTSQEMANRLLNVCKEYGLPYWCNKVGFQFNFEKYNFFEQNIYDEDFLITKHNIKKEISKTIINESEWMELLKNTEL